MPTGDIRSDLRRLWNLPRSVKRRLAAALHRARTKRVATSPAILAFWRAYGREWATEDASAADLDKLSVLAAQLAATPRKEKREQAMIAFRKIWNSGFSNSSEAFPWDGMKEDLPLEAMIAFVEGAVSAAHRART